MSILQREAKPPLNSSNAEVEISIGDDVTQQYITFRQINYTPFSLTSSNLMSVGILMIRMLNRTTGREVMVNNNKKNYLL